MGYLICLAGSIFLLDQMSKWVVRTTMVEGETVSVYRDILNLCYVKNEGIAFGLLQNQGPLLILIASIAIIAILIFFRRIEHQDIWTKLAMGLVLGGAAGNLFDRLRFGGVIDFLDVGLSGYRWPAFNLADSSICLGAGMVVYHWIKKR